MASILKVDTLTGVTTAGSISVTGEGNSTTTNLQQGLAKFWIAMNGSGTPAAVDSFNVGSITDVGTGNYKFNFSNNFNTAKGYWTTGCAAYEDDHDGAWVKHCMPMQDDDVLTSSLEISVTYTSSSSTGDYDYTYVNMAGLGDLA
jgi:hypothetical protein